MTQTLPYLMEDPKKPYKVLLKEYYPQKAKGMSFFAFIFSIFVYISIFYIFNLSPSTLFKTSKFWFLISNTLIIILAADYGAFSSSKDKPHDVSQEYFAHRRVTNPSSSFTLEHQEIIVNESDVVVREEKQTREEEDHVEKCMHEDKEEESAETPEKTLFQSVAMQPQQEDFQEKRIVHVGNKKVGDLQTRRRAYHKRSKSDRPKRVVFDETKNIVVLRRSETEKNQEKMNDYIEEMNEFSTMSDEDLNRRVEDFIQRFNRQIRLQARDDK